MTKSKDTDNQAETVSDVEDKADEIVDAEVIEETPVEPVALEDPEAGSEDVEAQPVETADKEVSGEDSEPAVEEVISGETPKDSPVPAKRGGFIPMVVGGAVAAGLGFGAATYLGNDREGAALLETRLAEQERDIEALKSADKLFSQRINKSLANLDGIADVKQRLAALSDEVAQIEARLVKVEENPIGDGLNAEVIETYRREVEALRGQVDAELAEAEAIKAQSEKSARATYLRAALHDLTAALDKGEPYQKLLSELVRARGEIVPADLVAYAETGVPTVRELSEAFPELSRAALRDARSVLGIEREGNRIVNFLKEQFGARSVKPVEGNSPDAVLSRAEAAIKEDRISDALAEIETLPSSSKALLAPWKADAMARAKALAARNALALELND